ncbi:MULTISPECIES: DUF1622 domain-containing protein [Psychrilyobacter]|uniref:DUF1622 domain-containing protein n=1 Tax=Psychrilyobacter piezotolerans TaxID=2293438 RepID=A0ABX9KGI4_9FUSO|nr:MULTISPECIES: DUF1622 domain-containing protein [Psychrilyobacter]MCS5420357.1 DUF1622 domain-containing protein [Psychrilyobacter sp. S5]NDI78061.1 DUF1622 domain-containing protein [Psychrilyobacter piezotolerans]RDE61652.1 DUF1622 domain-containing protein [Psychrilyobacter sp. S5]REI41044.1 DUF1622 domain-containing protein [Psychrilyobacter piezotolerans]
MQNLIRIINEIIINMCQLLASIVILLGVIKALIIYVKDLLFQKNSLDTIQESRLEIGHSFSLGLAFLIGASILKTIITPNWNDIGQLAATIAIRTTLNHFLLNDLKNIFEKENNADTPEGNNLKKEDRDNKKN